MYVVTLPVPSPSLTNPTTSTSVSPSTPPSNAPAAPPIATNTALIIALIGVLSALLGAFLNHLFTARRDDKKWDRDRRQEAERWERERKERHEQWLREDASRQEQWLREDASRWHKERLAAYSAFFHASDQWVSEAHLISPSYSTPDDLFEYSPSSNSKIADLTEKIGTATSDLDLFSSMEVRVAVWELRAKAWIYLNECALASNSQAVHSEVTNKVQPILTRIDELNAAIRAMIRAELGIDIPVSSVSGTNEPG